MEKNEVIEGNRSVAEFLGFYITDFNGKYHFVCKEKKKPEHLNYAWEFRLEEAKYHSSWDWLMPVLAMAKKKIADAGWATPQEKSAKARLGAALNEAYNINIEAAHYCLVQFIKWYNVQSITPNT